MLKNPARNRTRNRSEMRGTAVSFSSEKSTSRGVVESVSDIERTARSHGQNAVELPSFEHLMPGELSLEW
jgi:hypothetical protein